MNKWFPSSLNRLQYLVRSVLLVLFPFTFLDPDSKAIDPMVGGFMALFLMALLIAAVILKIKVFDIPRITNAGYPPIYLLLFLVPIANVLLQLFLFMAPPRKTN